MLFYRAALPLSHQTLPFVSDLIRTHRKQLGSVWRALNPGQQALLVLVYLRKGEPFAEIGAGFAVSTATCWRYVNETIELLAEHAPKLRAALRKAKRQGMAYVIIDGTLIPIDRIAVDRPFYSGKHRRHGVNLQVIASPDGTILWVSGQLPGSTHDTTAARIWNMLAALRDAGLIALGDKGYHGYDQTGQQIRTPHKGRNKPESRKEANRAHARLRGPGERANAQLKTWRVLRKLRCSPTAPADWPRPSTFCRTTSSPQDEKAQWRF
ncbi:response regulator receiver [Kutzneria sp. 744]|nr:response regulator receiver [Kutzneria sp. 744]